MQKKVRWTSFKGRQNRSLISFKMHFESCSYDTWKKFYLNFSSGVPLIFTHHDMKNFKILPLSRNGPDILFTHDTKIITQLVSLNRYNFQNYDAMFFLEWIKLFRLLMNSLTDGWFCSPPLGKWYYMWWKRMFFRNQIFRFAHNVWFVIFTFFDQNNQFSSK